MSDSEQRVPIPCSQCGRPGVHGYEAGGERFNLCVEHAAIYDENTRQNVAMFSHLANEAYAQIYGLPSQPLQLPNPAPRVNVSNVNFRGDNLGVINTGQIDALTNSVRVVNQHDPALAQAFAQLANGIVASADLVDAQKAEALDLLRALSDNAGTPSAQRQPIAAMKAIGTALQTILANSANLMQVWPVIASALGL